MRMVAADPLPPPFFRFQREVRMLKRWTITGWRQLCLGVLLLALFAGQTAAAEKPVVLYDKASDKLSITAENVSLKELLARIGLLSGVGFFMDPKAEQPVSAALKDEHLERGLKRIMTAHGLSYAMIYERPQNQALSTQAPLLIAMKVAPGGSGPGAATVPIIDVEGEAVIRSFPARPSKNGEQLPSMFDHAQERWQARLQKMSAKQRRKLEAKMKEQQAKQAARREKRETRRAERKSKRIQKQAKRQAAEDKLKETNPELYELRRQRREELRQQIKDQIEEGAE
jgi:type II secretory pathway component GspD/PulD (secretin)